MRGPGCLLLVSVRRVSMRVAEPPRVNQPGASPAWRAAAQSIPSIPLCLALRSCLRAERPVHRYGVIALAVLAAGLLIAVNAVTARADAAVLPDPELLPGSRTRTRPGPAPASLAASGQPGHRARRQHSQARRARPARRAVPRRRRDRRQRPPRSQPERRLPRRMGPLGPRRAAGHHRQPAPLAGPPDRRIRSASAASRPAGRRPHPRGPATTMAVPDPAEPAWPAPGGRPARQHRRRHLHPPLRLTTR